ncbi:MAG: FKBP-type peptidyl-prolyl cis-trans isomerase [Oscillospiraceae bacterium]|nr:FKBP-type peptidyl-prolyl cis-trans isomerase [Oscillospiraceae bacterium]
MAQQKKNTNQKNKNSVTVSRKRIVIIAVAVAVVLALLIGSVVYILVQWQPWANQLDVGPTNGAPHHHDHGHGAQQQILGDNDFDPFAGVDFSHYVEFGEWRGVVVDMESFDDEQLLMAVRANFAEPTDRTVVQHGDVVTFDFDGYAEGLGRLDGMAFEGADITVGSGTFIPGFEEQMIGAVIGRTFDIRVTFPDDYPQNPDLEGVDAVFTTVVHEILAPPAQLTEEQVFMASEGATTDLDDFLGIMFNQIRDMAAMQAFHEVFDNVNFIGNLPAAANIYEHMGERGVFFAQEDVVVFAIATQEGIVITPDDVNEELERFRRVEGEESIAEMMAEIRQAEGDDLTEEELMLIMVGQTRAEFVRSLMFARIGELIFRYAVDSDGNSVYIEARETSRS